MKVNNSFNSKDFDDHKQQGRQSKPELTEEELQEMFIRLQASKAHSAAVTITVFGEYENKQIGPYSISLMFSKWNL